MAKINTLTKTFFLILFILNQIQTDDSQWIDFYKNKESAKETIDKSKEKASRYAVDFYLDETKEKFYDGPSYLKIEVTSTDEKPAPLLCFSNSDPWCENRLILSKNPNGKSTFIWAKREQYEDSDDEPYFVVTCAQGDSCSYIIEITGGDEASIKPNLVYSYLANNKNSEMQFKITDIKLPRLSVCLEGSKTAQIELAYEGIVENDYVKCANLAVQEGDNAPILNIKKASENDYITLTVFEYNITEDGEEYHLGRVDAGFLMPNGPQITGYIYNGHTTEQCFRITEETFKKSSDYLYLSGKIYSKYAWFFIELPNGDVDYDANVDVEVVDSQFYLRYKNPKSERLLCFEIPTLDEFKQSFIMFSFQILDYDKQIEIFEYTHPQISGQIYRRLISPGSIYYYYVAKSESGKEKYDYTLSNIQGNAKLYIDTECEDFPDCHYNENKLKTLTKTVPVTLNNQQIWYTNYDVSSALNIVNNLMIVHCDANDEYNKNGCLFETSIFYKGQDISLIENQKFYKYVSKEEKGNIIIDLKDNRIVQLIVVDIMIFSGDVTFTVQKYESDEEPPITESDIKYYYLSNKILINLNRPKKTVKRLEILYKANLNSFFDIKYTIDSLNSEQYKEFLDSGESYLVQINPLTKTKQIKMKNYYEDKSPFLINFFELNCEFDLNYKQNPLIFSDGYVQHYFKAGEGEEDELTEIYSYEFDLKIKQQDLSSKMCAIYIAGTELDSKHDKDIVVAANINQQIIFDDIFKKVRFTYPISDIYKDITYHVNVIDKAFYKLTGYMNGIKMDQINGDIVATTTTFYLYGAEIRAYCKNKDALCVFTLQVEYSNKIIESTKNPMVEITFREVLNVPTYLQKGSAKLDYVCGDKYYYLYTDISRKEEAEITLNFWREFGNLWARVVKKDLKVAEPEANWREVYRMPGPKWEDSLPYDTFTKKLKVSSEDTEMCTNGCYLLISIQVNDIGAYIPDHYFYYFTVLAKVTPSQKSYTDLPKVVMQVDEYIIGSLNTTELDDKYCSDYYQIWLPHDSNTVEFDWQSTLANLYINVGDNRPTPKNPDFILEAPGLHSVLYLSKKEILEQAKKKGIEQDTLEDISLTIGIWTDKKDSVKTELYSLRIHEPEMKEDTLEIIPVHADQKIMCTPKKEKVGLVYYYRCYFMIMYDSDVSNFSPLYLYGGSIDTAAVIDIYGNMINKDIYDSYNEKELINNIPTSDSSNYNTYKDGVDYIYVANIPYEYKSYLFVTLESNTPDQLYLINSIPLYDPSYEETPTTFIYPNSFTEQIYSCRGDALKMTFPGDEGLSVIITVLAGEGELNWDNNADIYKLKGYGDRINLITNKYTRTLNIRNLKPVNSLKETMEDPGFLFYIRYKSRTDNKNFDEVDFGLSTEFAYQKTKLPVIIYSRFDNNYEDLSISISFKDNTIKTFGDYAIYPVLMRASIMSEDSVIKAKNNELDIIPGNMRGGYYDPGTQTGLLYLSKKDIQGYNVKDSPTVYIRLDQLYMETEEQSQFTVEVQINGVSNDTNKDNAIPVEKVYHFGALGQDRESIIYPLKLFKNKLFVRVQVAFNSPNLDFCLNVFKDARKNLTFDYSAESKKFGKIYFTFMKSDENMNKIYLIIFRKDPKKVEDFQSNFVFKYINAQSETEFFDYPPTYPELTKEIKKDPSDSSLDILKVTFNQIHPDQGEANITYSLKVIDNATYRYDEEINTIAVTQSFPIAMVYERNPEVVDDEITLTAKGAFSNWGIINVVAQIQQKNIIEYVAYNGFKEIRPSNNKNNNDNDDDKSSNAMLFGIIGAILGVIVIVLIIVIIVFQIKNKALMNQVKHVSFQKTNSGTDPNLLLQKPEGDAINS